MKHQPKDKVKIAEFKAHLSQYLRNVRAGHPLTLMDRETPIARVLPFTNEKEKLVIRHATLRPDQVHFPPRVKKKIDILKYLAEERQSYR